MSDAYTYRVTPAAARDIAEIADYIAVELCARESAVKIIDAMEAAIQSNENTGHRPLESVGVGVRRLCAAAIGVKRPAL